jgi:indole-3-glycerol phosphate synthase
MVNNILEKIINKKKERLNELKKIISIESLQEIISKNDFFINFKEKIKKNFSNNKISLIAEIKKASPSAGLIIKDYNPVDLAKKYYENNATCLSVLCEEDFFQGNLIHLHKIKKKINLPILCKVFFIDPFLVLLSKSY